MCHKQKAVSIPASYCEHFFLWTYFSKFALNSIGHLQGSPQGLWFKGPL